MNNIHLSIGQVLYRCIQLASAYLHIYHLCTEEECDQHYARTRQKENYNHKNKN